MDHRITQCPRCGTSFRVTEAHLAVAAGAVRCGSCLHIFNARDHWVEDKPTPPPVQEAALSSRAIEEFEIDDDALFDDDTPLFTEDPEPARASGGSIFNPIDDDFALIDDGGPERLTSNFIELNSWEEDASTSFGRVSEATDEESSASDESWTQSLLNDDDYALPQTSSSLPPSPEGSDTILEQVPETDEFELNDEFLEIPSALHSNHSSLDASASNTRPNATKPADNPDAITMDALYATDRPEESASPNPLFNLNNLGEPLQLHQFVHEPRWPKVLWALAFVAAAALLIGQLIFANFSTLAHGALRPWLTRACAVANCSLPPQSDLSLIHASSLIVRSHPSHRGALAVDAIITNQATFPQLYPQLLLQFTDLNGTAVAGRRFLPSEYLAGELSGSQLMPVQQPVHIALELVDPGPQAVNYSLTVAPTSVTP